MKEIIELYSQIVDKKGLIKTLSKEYTLSEKSIESNWLSSWKIPLNYQKGIKEILKTELKTQIKKQEKLWK